MELKEICKAVRQKMGLTQREFGRLIGTTQTEISFVENGFIPPHIERVAEIQRLYHKFVGKEVIK